MNKKSLTEADIRTKFITPAIVGEHGASRALMFTFCLWVYERDEIRQRFYTEAGIPHFTGKALARSRCPLPHLAEQGRIVAKVDRLMALVDELETQLAASRATGDHLLAGVVADPTSAS